MTNIDQAFAAAHELTDDNQHQEAVLLIAKHFKCSAIAKAVQGVITIHEARRQMDPPMIEMMHILRSELYAAVEAAHGHDVMQAVRRCF